MAFRPQFNSYENNVMKCDYAGNYTIISINKYKSSQSDMWESYSEIAKKYYDTQALLISNSADSLENIDESLNKLYFGLQGTLSAEAAQTLLVYDVNNDGIPEFFIARKYPGESKNTIYAGYTWKDGKLYQLMKGQEIGYRSGTIDLREDGKVLSFSSGSAWTFGVDVYILPENGTEFEKVEGACAIEQEDNGNRYSVYYQQTEGQDKKEINEADYNQYIKQFREIPLSFIEITDETIENYPLRLSKWKKQLSRIDYNPCEAFIQIPVILLFWKLSSREKMVNCMKKITVLKGNRFID